MNQDLQDQLNDLAAQVERLIEQATTLCGSAEPTDKVDSVSSVLSNLRKYNDYVYAVTKNEPPGDMIVRVKHPESGETVRLEASWSTEANGFRLRRVPIELATVARVIDSELADHKHTGSVYFHWDAIPVGLEELLE